MNALPCGICGCEVKITAKRYLELVAAEREPIHRECRRIARYACERSGQHEIMDAARVTESYVVRGFAGMRYVLGSGKRAHNLAPLANGCVRRVAAGG